MISTHTQSSQHPGRHLPLGAHRLLSLPRAPLWQPERLGEACLSATALSSMVDRRYVLTQQHLSTSIHRRRKAEETLPATGLSYLVSLYLRLLREAVDVRQDSGEPATMDGSEMRLNVIDVHPHHDSHDSAAASATKQVCRERAKARHDVVSRLLAR